MLKANQSQAVNYDSWILDVSIFFLTFAILGALWIIKCSSILVGI